jgi:uncharacterized protein (TIGR02594 family)
LGDTMTMEKVPASIRNRNPGAMWPGPSAAKFGSKAMEQLTDKQKNQMATFPTHVEGAAAMFDLLLRLYAGKRLSDAIEMWSGQNSVAAYLAVIKARVGLKGTAILTAAYLEDPATGIPFAKAMAFHEAGEEYPLSDDEWRMAHSLALGAKPGVPAHLEWLQARVGLKEVPGKGSNPDIDAMFLICGYPREKFRDDTAWCAVCGYAAVAETGGYITPAPDNTMAKSFLRWGVPVKEADIRPGDFRVEDRGADKAFGHVDCVESVDRAKGTVTVIGGNVGNAVTRSVKPIKGAAGYRRREDAPKPVMVAARESPSVMMIARGAVVGAVYAVVEGWQALVGLLPGVAHEVTQTVAPVQTISEQTGIAVPPWLLGTLALTCVAGAVVRMVQNRREAA